MTLLTEDSPLADGMPSAGEVELARLRAIFRQPGFSTTYSGLLHAYFSGSAKRKAVLAALRALVKSGEIRCERGNRKNAVLLTSTAW